MFVTVTHPLVLFLNRSAGCPFTCLTDVLFVIITERETICYTCVRCARGAALLLFWCVALFVPVSIHEFFFLRLHPLTAAMHFYVLCVLTSQGVITVDNAWSNNPFVRNVTQLFM